MSENWLGIIVSGDKIKVVNTTFVADNPISINGEHTWKLQTGSRPEAYQIIYDQVSDYILENCIDRVVIKDSAVSQGRTSLSHLRSAELRGVVTAAASKNTNLSLLAKSQISRNFGSRKSDEYTKDDEFWSTNVAKGNPRSLL